MAPVESSASLDNNLRDVCDNDFRFPVVKRDLSRYSHGFALVLLRIREVPGAGGWNKGGDDLIRVLAAQVAVRINERGIWSVCWVPACYPFSQRLSRKRSWRS